MKLVSALLGSGIRCSLCHRARAAEERRRTRTYRQAGVGTVHGFAAKVFWQGHGHLCIDCFVHLYSLERQREKIQLQSRGRSIPDLDPALRASHGDESVIEEISHGLESTNSRVRNYAARELQLLNNPLAVDALGVCLVKHNSDSALSALRSIGDIRAAEYLYTALNVDDAWWRPQQEGINAGLVGGTDGEVAYETVY